MKSRRRIAFPKAQDHANSLITAGICDQRNGVWGSVCTAAILGRSCPPAVIYVNVLDADKLLTAIAQASENFPLPYESFH
jgi:hypothetical protein